MDRTIGDRLRDTRKRLGLSQRKMADVGGVGLGSQHRYEAGALPPTEYLLKIGEAGADWYFILTGERSGSRLDQTESELVGCFRDTDADNRETILRVARALADRRTTTQSVHASRLGFTAERPETA